MHTYIFQKGSTGISIELEIIDSTDGTPENGVVFDTAGIDLEYRRDGAVSVDITEADLTTPLLTDAWEEGGFLFIGNGVYRFDIPDAALAAGADKVLIHGTVTGMVVIPCVIQLVDYDPFSATNLGLSDLAQVKGSSAANNAFLAVIVNGLGVDGLTWEETLRVLLAGASGELSGAPSGPMVFKSQDGNIDRITAPIDGNGNRTSSVLDVSDQ